MSAALASLLLAPQVPGCLTYSCLCLLSQFASWIQLLWDTWALCMLSAMQDMVVDEAEEDEADGEGEAAGELDAVEDPCILFITEKVGSWDHLG